MTSGAGAGLLGLCKSFAGSYPVYLVFEFLETVLGASVYPAAFVLSKYMNIIIFDIRERGCERQRIRYLITNCVDLCHLLSHFWTLIMFE